MSGKIFGCRHIDRNRILKSQVEALRSMSRACGVHGRWARISSAGVYLPFLLHWSNCSEKTPAWRLPGFHNLVRRGWGTLRMQCVWIFFKPSWFHYIFSACPSPRPSWGLYGLQCSIPLVSCPPRESTSILQGRGSYQLWGVREEI